MSQYLKVNFERLQKGDSHEIAVFTQQIKTNGWCCMKLPDWVYSMTPPHKLTKYYLHSFFKQPEHWKKQFIASSKNKNVIGYIQSSTNERYRILTGYKYVESHKTFSPTEFKIKSKLFTQIDQMATVLLKVICNNIIEKQNMNTIVSNNEICLVRDQYHINKTNECNIVGYIASNWMDHTVAIIPQDVIKLIGVFCEIADKNKIANFNYGMLEFIQYNKPLQTVKNNDDKPSELMSVNEHFDVGFVTINLGSNKPGLQLFDRITNKYIDCNWQHAFIWIGASCHEISNGKIPVGLHRVKWVDQCDQKHLKRQTTIYEICVGNQIQHLSYDYGTNWIELPQLELYHNKDIQKITTWDAGSGNKDSGDSRLFVKTLSGKIYCIWYNIDDNITVRKIKKDLEELQGIPAERMRLIFKGKLITDDTPITSYGIKPEDTVHSAIMLRG